MSIDDLATAIRKCSPEHEVQRLAELLIAWKATTETVEDLRRLGDKYLGTAWLSNDEVHHAVYELWSEFSRSKIGRIAGMTMNERLFAFGMLDAFDSAGEDARTAIYGKLLAKR